MADDKLTRRQSMIDIAISQSAYADPTRLQFVLRQTMGVIGLSRSSDSELRPSMVKTCTWGLWTRTYSIQIHLKVGWDSYHSVNQSGEITLRWIQTCDHAVSKQFSQYVVREKTRVRLNVIHFLLWRFFILTTPLDSHNVQNKPALSLLQP